MNLLRSIVHEVIAKSAGLNIPGSPQRNSFGSAIRSGVQAWLASQYDAAQKSRDRSWLRGWVQDARFDTTQADLNELIRISRNFERNDPIAQRFAALWEQYTVGPTGFNIVPSSSNPKWNKIAKSVYDGWAEYADVSSRASIGAMQTLAARRWFFDGRTLLLKTRDPENGRPRIQMLEPHRLCTPSDRVRDEGRTFFSGIEVDPTTGRVVRYWLKQDFLAGEPKPQPAEMVVDICETDRPWDVRPVPVITPALLPLHDLRDLQTLTMRQAKQFAAISTVFKTRDGNIPRAQLTSRRLTTTGSLSDGTATTEQRIHHIRESYGGEMLAIHPDEEIVQPQGNKLSQNEETYWQVLISLACIGVSIPKLLVFPHSMQGTVARYDMDAANSFFRSRSAVLQAAFTRVYRWFIEEESRRNSALNPLPVDWFKVTVRPPRSVNADVGRNSRARLDELANGAFTFTDHFAESGDDLEEQWRKRGKEAQLRQQLAIEFGVDPNEIAIMTNEQPQPEVVENGNQPSAITA